MEDTVDKKVYEPFDMVSGLRGFPQINSSRLSNYAKLGNQDGFILDNNAVSNRTQLTLKKCTREDIVNELHEKTGYYKKAIYVLLKAYGEVVLGLLDNVTEDEEVVIQLVEGIRVGVKVVPQRERIDPRTYETILCEPTIKPFAKFSKNFRYKLNQKHKSEDQTEG